MWPIMTRGGDAKAKRLVPSCQGSPVTRPSFASEAARQKEGTSPRVHQAARPAHTGAGTEEGQLDVRPVVFHERGSGCDGPGHRLDAP